MPQGNVVDFNGDYIGFVNGDGTVIDVLGTVLGRIDAKGRMFNEKGEYKGGVVQTGVGIGMTVRILGTSAKAAK